MLQKNKVKTVVVMATCSPREIILDQIEAIEWSCDESFTIVIVNDGEIELDLPYTVIKSKSKIKRASVVGFKVNEGIKWALDNIDFDMVMVLDDDALPIGRGLDTWALNKFKDNKNIGMIGTMDDVKACEMYRNADRVELCLKYLAEWCDISNWTPPNEVIFYAVNFQSRDLIEKLDSMNMLNVEKEIWPMPCETFQSWITTLAGFDLYFWGRYPDSLVPPLYSMHHGSVKPTDPRLISHEFLVHHSIRQTGADEWDIRNYYKYSRRMF